MIDLLQTAVNTGTGRAAQIGRPVAGKTGTTSSSKDGWFLGFSSGLTTGVWMGRDDAKPIAGLHGGTAPARAWHDFMIKAVANRPIEQFETQVTLPEAQLEPDAESYYGGPDNGLFVDPDGNPVPGGVPGTAPQGDRQSPRSEHLELDDDGNPIIPAPQPERLDQDWIDRVTGRDARQRRPASPPPGNRPPPSATYQIDPRPNQ